MAAQPLGPAETLLRVACAEDYRRLCTDTGEEASAVEACFRRKLGQVSPECQDGAAEFGEKARAERIAR